MHASTKKEAVETALREAIATRARQELISRLGTVEFDLSWGDIHRMREGD
jgi:hypothetical protein